MNVLYFTQTALIYQETFQLDTSNEIEQVLQALPLEVNEKLDVPLYRKKVGGNIISILHKITIMSSFI